MKELTILMPCLNEEKTIEACITQSQRFLKEQKIDGEILIADNGSTDRSLDLIKKKKVRYIHVQTKGYGSALKEGIKAARGKYIIMGDSDNTYDFYHLLPFYQHLKNGYHLVMGNRFKGGIEKGAMPLLNQYIGNPFLSWLARTLFPCEIYDFHCGLRGFHKDKIIDIDLESTGMEFASEIVIKAIINDFNIIEIPTTLSNNHIDRKPHLKPIKDSIRHIKLIFKLRYKKR